MRTVVSPEKVFLLRLCTSVGLLLVSAWLFGAIAEDVVHRDLPLGSLDLGIADSLHARATPALTSVMRVISLLGAPLVVALIASAAAAMLLWRRRRTDALLLMLAVGGAGLLNWIIKLLIHRNRPSFSDPFQILTSFSFPSGHTMGSTVLYGALAAIVFVHADSARARALVVAAAACLIVLIAFSRLYLGVHYLSDVVAGFIAGVAWLSACAAAVVAWRRERRTA